MLLSHSYWFQVNDFSSTEWKYLSNTIWLHVSWIDWAFVSVYSHWAKPRQSFHLYLANTLIEPWKKKVISIWNLLLKTFMLNQNKRNIQIIKQLKYIILINKQLKIKQCIKCWCFFKLLFKCTWVLCLNP